MISRMVRKGLVAAVAVAAVFPATAVASTVPAARTTAVRHAAHHHVRGLVTTHHTRLLVRSGPGTAYRVVGSRPDGHVVSLSCKKRGSAVRGNHRWYRLAHHRGYVSAHYVRTGGGVRWC
ncbi:MULTISPECIES: SH3 domain-containing protein [unclassified Streptomyces]|uniref:SH3 domain-containing protein n=1 Tax=unclassified Streptomyces TaxID=2593676 RepID=UPI002E2F20EF|nr:MULTISPECIES: SH3 domain-containing protein [unclassified Streptomyces]